MKKLFFSLLAVAAMASCSKSELTDRPVIGQDNVEIFAKSTAQSIDVESVKRNSAATRTPFEGSVIDNDHQLEAKVWATTTKGNYSNSNIAANYVPAYNESFSSTDKMIFTDANQVGFDTNSMYFPADKDIVYLFGLYPYGLTWSESTTGGQSSAVTSIDGKSDIMVAPQVEASKAKHQLATPEYPTLAFEHVLTKLIVKVKAENAAAISGWGKITDITLTGAAGGLKDQVSISCVDKTAGTPMTATFTAPTGNPASFDFFMFDTAGEYSDTAFKAQTTDAVVLTTDAANAAYVLVAPLSSTNVTTDKDFTLAIKTEKHTDPYTVDINLKDATNADYAQSTQGKYFEITLTFKATEVQAKATVAAWENGGNGGADIQ